MTREEIRNKIFQQLRAYVDFVDKNPGKEQQFQVGSLYSLFPEGNLPYAERQIIPMAVKGIIQELENIGVIAEGQATGNGQSTAYPWFTITEYGIAALKSENWLPYDPEGYVKALQEKLPDMDVITLKYIGEAVSAYNRRHLLSATITLGVASENLVLQLVEAYLDWLPAGTRQVNLKKKMESRFISTQYKLFKADFIQNISKIPADLQGDWETYLDTVFNFVRLNRNDAGHPTGKEMDVKFVYANLQVFAEYALFITRLIGFFRK